MKQSQTIRMHFPEGIGSFVTRRMRNSQLVYSNPAIQKRVLGALGKYVHKFDVTVYAFCFFGSHDHALYDFKMGTKSPFFRDLGSRTAEAVKKNIPSFGGGSVLEKRTSELAVPPEADGHLNAILYILLQPVAAGLCKDLTDYPGFSCLPYLISGKPLKVEFINGSAYQRAKAKSKNGKVDASNYTEEYEITFARIPGYEDMSQEEYGKFLMDRLNKRRQEIIDEFDKSGYKWPKPEVLYRTRSTDCAKHPKKSKRGGFHPLIICRCGERTKQFLEWYFSIVEQYRIASKKYLSGDRNAIFPIGTIKPPGPFVFAN